MPLLVDGNNLMHALADLADEVGRGGLVTLLAALAARGERICVVFDGPAGPAPMADDIASRGVDVVYAGGCSADDIIEQRIAADTAPRRLTVVSTDRRLRDAARKRRCKSITSQDFAPLVLRIVHRGSSRNAEAAEPPEKRRGLTPEQTARWLRRFGLDD